jgi:hypothetical protein
MVGKDGIVTLHFTFISEPQKPVVTIQVSKEIPFRESLVLAAKKQGKDPSVLSPIYPLGALITGETVDEVIEHGTNIHLIDPSAAGCW